MVSLVFCCLLYFQLGMFCVYAICVLWIMTDVCLMMSYEVLDGRIQNVLFVSDVIIYPLLMYKGVPLNAYHK